MRRTPRPNTISVMPRQPVFTATACPLSRISTVSISIPSTALAEKVLRGELREEDALPIGRQILRENALALFPQLKNRLWRK